MNRNYHAFILFLLLALPRLHAVDGGMEIRDAFDPAAARPPRVGEWLEYRLAYPVDPLENSLSTAPVPPPVEEHEQLDDSRDPFAFQPSFEPAVAWRVLPLRLEILDIDGSRCRVAMTFAGGRRTLDLPLARPDDDGAFHYEPPQPPDQRTRHRVGSEEYEVDWVRRHGRGYGFARLSNPGLPFGLARFATVDVDLVLVGMGEGTPPDFPLAVTTPISPAPGLFYTEAP